MGESQKLRIPRPRHHPEKQRPGLHTRNEDLSGGGGLKTCGMGCGG